MTIKQRQILLAVLWIALLVNGLAFVPNLLDGDWVHAIGNACFATGAATILILLRGER